jgi:hypothetical protein
MAKPFKLIAPIEKTFALTRTDELFDSDGTVVTVRQASQAQHELREAMWDTFVREERTDDELPDGVAVRYEQKFSFLELMRVEAQLTVVESNIMTLDDSQLFWRGMSKAQFDKAWGQLPAAVCSEIHAKVLEANPDWARPNQTA